MLLADMLVDMLAQLDQVNSPSVVAQVEIHGSQTNVDTTVWAGQAVEQDGGTFASSEIAQGRILSPNVIYILRSSGWLQEHGITDPNPRISAVIETMPKHGQIESIKPGAYIDGVYYKDELLYRYTPDPGFLGRDIVVFVVTIEDKKIRVVSDLDVVKDIPVNDPTEDDSVDLFESISFSDLSNASLAQTTGTGSSAQITLDLDAAGYGWFIDYTPYLNEEYLPTRNPYEWIAQPGGQNPSWPKYAAVSVIPACAKADLGYSLLYPPGSSGIRPA